MAVAPGRIGFFEGSLPLARDIAIALPTPDIGTASWRSGHAEDCKSLYPSSILGEASNRLPAASCGSGGRTAARSPRTAFPAMRSLLWVDCSKRGAIQAAPPFCCFFDVANCLT